MIETAREEPCPFCGVGLPQWRHDLVAAYKAAPEDEWQRQVLDAAVVNHEEGMDPMHALYHIPESC